MSFQFQAQWLKSANGEESSVLIELSTGRRETSPWMKMNPDEVVVSGVQAKTLAQFGEGEITSVRKGEESFLRILPVKGTTLVIA